MLKFIRLFMISTFCLGMIPAVTAQDCDKPPSEAATNTKAQLDQMIEDGIVQFAGYVAMLSYARETQNCADKALYEALYVKAVDNLPNSKMRRWENWSVSKGQFQYPRSAANDGFGGTCTVKFNLPHAGQAEDVKVTCTNPAFKSAVRKLMKTTYFAPPTLNEGFTKGEDLKIEMDFGLVIGDWLF